jgi:hypothetical protein
VDQLGLFHCRHAHPALHAPSPVSTLPPSYSAPPPPCPHRVGAREQGRLGGAGLAHPLARGARSKDQVKRFQNSEIRNQRPGLSREKAQRKPDLLQRPGRIPDETISRPQAVGRIVERTTPPNAANILIIRLFILLRVGIVPICRACPFPYVTRHVHRPHP